MPVPSQRVLHIVENLNRGAVENWLVRMLRHARRRGVNLDWTFYCAVGKPGELDEEARTLGAGVIYSPVPIGSKAAFVRALRAELRRGGYGVLHCHHDLVSALYLLAAMGLPIRRRIVHVHNADEVVPTPSRLKQRLLREPMRGICLTMADRVVGISNHTLDSFLCGRPRQPERDSVHYYGIDLAPFASPGLDRVDFRRQLDIPANGLILLFGGRLVPEKNPLFAVDVLASMRRIEPMTFLVYAGTGSEERHIRVKARELGLEHFTRFLGWRADLPEIMSCSDWFILPHPEDPVEGFGVAVVEAQLAGLPMLLSRGILDDPLMPAARFRRLALSAEPDEWAKAAMELFHAPVPSKAQVMKAFDDSRMDMDRALQELMALHA